MFDNAYLLPCPNPGCVEGHVEVFYAHAEDPLSPVLEVCESCQGQGVLFVSQDLETLNVH